MEQTGEYFNPKWTRGKTNSATDSFSGQSEVWELYNTRYKQGH